MLDGLGMWTPGVHVIVTAVHIFAGVFWLGWMVFMFGVLRPVAATVVPERAARLQRRLRQRVRRIVFWVIPILLLTGLHNMAYHGLLDGAALLSTARGHRMLAKLGAAGVLFGIYYAAPLLLRQEGAGGHASSDCHGPTSALARRTAMGLHLVAFVAGVTAAMLGVSLGG